MWPLSFRSRYKTSSWAHRLAVASGRQGCAKRPDGQGEAVPALYTMLLGTGAGAHLAVVLQRSYGLYFILFPPNIMTQREGWFSLFTARQHTTVWKKGYKRDGDYFIFFKERM